MLFKVFWEKWLESKFSMRLEQARHDQQKIIEQLKFQLNAIFDKKIKLHQKEFDVLHDVWEKLVKANNRACFVTFPFQSYPDFNRMNEQELEEWFETARFSKSKMKDVRESHNRNETAQKFIIIQEINDAKIKCKEFLSYFKKKRFLYLSHYEQNYRKWRILSGRLLSSMS